MWQSGDGPHGADRDRDGHRDAVADDDRRGRDRRAQPLDERLELALVADLVEQHAELLPAPARRHVARARRVVEPARDLAQHEVADLVAVAVVDALEVVDVDERDRGARRRAGEARAQHLGEVPPVEQLGQRVHAREPLQPAHGLGALVLGTALVRDVAHRAGEQHAPVAHGDGGAVAHPAGHPVDADETVVLLHDLAVAAEHVGEPPRGVERRAVIGMDELVVAVDELVRLLGGAQQIGQPGAVRVHDEPFVREPLAAVEVLADDLGRAREGLAHGGCLGDQRGALGDVLDHDDARGAIRRDADRDDRREALAALAAEDDVVLAAAVEEDVGDRLAQGLVGLRRPVRQRRRHADDLVGREPGELAHLLVDAHRAAIGTEDHEAVLERSHDRVRDLPRTLRLGPRALRARARETQSRGQAVCGGAGECETREGRPCAAAHASLAVGRSSRKPIDRCARDP